MKKMFKTVASLALGCALLSTSAFAALDGSVAESATAGTYTATVTKADATAWESTILVLKAGSVTLEEGKDPAIGSVSDSDIYYINQTSAKSATAEYSIAQAEEKLYVFAGGSDETAAKFLGAIDAKVVNVPVTGLTLEAEGLTATEEGADYDYTAALTVEDVMNITATVAPETATDKTVVWSASNENATVVDGVVTAVAAGDVVITAKAGDVTKTIAITISKKAPSLPESAAIAVRNSEAKDSYAPYGLTGYSVVVVTGIDAGSVAIKDADGNEVAAYLADYTAEGGARQYLAIVKGAEFTTDSIVYDAEGASTALVFGELDGAEGISPADAIIALDTSAGVLVAGTDLAKLATDVDADGSFTPADAIITLDVSAGVYGLPDAAK